jgi:hypothetical protein
MGLMYQFPNNLDDHQHIIRTENVVTVRSYGLPPIFWGYLAAILLIYSMMMIGVSGPLGKLSQMPDTIDQVIFYLVITFLIIFPIVAIGFFFYEKNIISDQKQVTVVNKLFFISISRNSFNTNDYEFIIEHFLDSPNMARMQSNEELKGFENKGYFQLMAVHKNNKSRIMLDRSSRKVDLEKLKKILKINN